MKRKLLLCALVCLLLISLSACGKKSFVGTWEGDDREVTFNEDGTGTWATEKGSDDITWSTEDDTLSVTGINGEYKPFDFTYEFRNSGHELFLEYGTDYPKSHISLDRKDK